MSLTRQTQKVFGSNANANQLAVFGSMKTGTPVYSTSLATLQSTAYTQGWSEALLNDKAPYMEEMNAVQYGLSYQIAYMLQEGAFAYDANTTYSSTSIVKAFEDGKMYFYHSLIDNNTGHALSDTTYWEKINISDTRNIGEIVTSTIPLTDAGLHLLDGSLLSGSGSCGAFVSYIAGLYTADPTANYFTTEADWQTAVSTYGVCGKFVYDSVNNTVRLPKITGFIEGGSDVSTLGNLTLAGLPNITGSIEAKNMYNATSTTGAFTYTDEGTSNKAGDGGTNSHKFIYTFNASDSNTIYGNSITVQPQSVKVLYYIVVATSTKTDIQVDIDEIATDLNGKADVDLSNTNDTAAILMSVQGMPSDIYEDLSLGASGSTYTAPSNGWFLLSKVSGASSKELSMEGASNLTAYVVSTANSQTLSCYLPVKKNDVVTVSYTATGTTQYFRFVYAKGSESEAS